MEVPYNKQQYQGKTGKLESRHNGLDLVQAFQNEGWVKPGFIAL